MRYGHNNGVVEWVMRGTLRKFGHDGEQAMRMILLREYMRARLKGRDWGQIFVLIHVQYDLH